MSKADNMAKLPGLFQREGVWTLRIMIPKDLKQAYGGRTKVVESLQTTDTRQANALGTARRGEWLAEFGRKRLELNPQKLDRIPPELARVLAERVAVRTLQHDEELRQAPPASVGLLLDSTRALGSIGQKLFLGAKPAPSAPRYAGQELDPLDGLTPEMLDELAAVNAAQSGAAASALAGQRLSSVLPLVQAEAKAMGLEFDASTPGAREALREALQARRAALQGVEARDRGEVVDTPTRPTAAGTTARAKGIRLRDIYADWLGSRKKAGERRPDAERALKAYEEGTGNPPIAELTRAQGVALCAFLRSMGVADKTASDRFDIIKGFLNFAAQDLELIPKNPWKGLQIAFSDKKRAPYSLEQLQRLLARPLFTQYAIPKAFNAGGDAAYWIPLLGLFTGARVSELAQLRVADFDTVNGVQLLRITDEGEGQRVKSDAGRRVVPLHPELIRLGFPEYVAHVKASKVARREFMFPALPLLASKPGNYFSNWFSEYVKEGEGPALPTFHHFRHSVRTRLTHAGAGSEPIDALIGHEASGSQGSTKYTHHDERTLLQAVSKLQYEGLEIPRVYSAPAKLVRVTRRAAAAREV